MRAGVLACEPLGLCAPPSRLPVLDWRHGCWTRVRSVLGLSEAVSEEEEGGALVVLVLLVGEAEGALVVHLVTDEKLELIKLANNELDELGGALLEAGHAVLLALLLQLLGHLGEVALHPLHEFGLGEALHFVELELILNVDHGFTTFIVGTLLVGGDFDAFLALSDVLGLSLDAGVVHGDLMGERVREELVAGKKVNPNSHLVFPFLFCFL